MNGNHSTLPTLYGVRCLACRGDGLWANRDRALLNMSQPFPLPMTNLTNGKRVTILGWGAFEHQCTTLR